MTDLPIQLAQVSSIDSADSVVRVAFRGIPGEFAISRTDSRAAEFQRLLQRSLERQSPVGVRLHGNAIAHVSRAHNDFVLSLQYSDPQRGTRIMLRGHDGIYYVPDNQHNRDDLITLLKQAGKLEQRIWFIAEPQTLNVQDVWVVEHED